MTENQPSQAAPVTPTIGSGETAPVAPATPAVDAPVTPAVETPVSEPATETPAAEPASEPAKPDAASSVLGDDAAKTEVKTDAKTEVDTTKSDTAPETKTETALPAYEDFKLPEGFVSDKESISAFNKLLGEIETGKLDHKEIQEKGQALIDLGVKSINESITKLNDYYVQIHEKQKTDWFDAFKGDAEIGGEKVESTIKTVRDAVDSFGGSPEQIKELRSQLKESGYGNYPPLIRLINNMQAKIDSYTKETKQPVVPGAKPAPTAVKPYQAFYSKG